MKRGGASVAEDRSANREYRGGAVAVKTEVQMTRRVNPAKATHELPSRQTPADLVAGEPGGEQLPAPHHARLGLRER